MSTMQTCFCTIDKQQMQAFYDAEIQQKLLNHAGTILHHANMLLHHALATKVCHCMMPSSSKSCCAIQEQLSTMQKYFCTMHYQQKQAIAWCWGWDTTKADEPCRNHFAPCKHAVAPCTSNKSKPLHDAELQQKLMHHSWEPWKHAVEPSNRKKSKPLYDADLKQMLLHHAWTVEHHANMLLHHAPATKSIHCMMPSSSKCCCAIQEQLSTMQTYCCTMH